MFVLGLLGYLYKRDTKILDGIVRETFARKEKEIIDNNIALLEAGYKYAEQHIHFQFEVPATPSKVAMMTMNGNTADRIRFHRCRF